MICKQVVGQRVGTGGAVASLVTGFCAVTSYLETPGGGGMTRSSCTVYIVKICNDSKIRAEAEVFGPFGAPDEKKRNVCLRSHRNFGRFDTNLFPVALFVSELQSFFQWPPVVFYRFPICVSARGPPKRARIAFLLIDHLNHIEKESTWCARITRRIAPSG